MGKYIRKGKGVGKIPVIEGSLGVRTRARALALQKDHTNKPVPSQSIPSENSGSFMLQQGVATGSHSVDCSNPLPKPLHVIDIPRQESQPQNQSQPQPPPQQNYMELRSRRLQKVTKPPFTSTRQQQACISYPHAFLRTSIPRRSNNSEDESARWHVSVPVNTMNTNTPAASHVQGSRNVSPSRQFCKQSSAFDAGSVHLRRVTPTGSTSNSVSMSERQSFGILTRHRRQELASMIGRDDMEIEGEASISRKASHSQMDKNNSAEVEQFFGESRMETEASNRERRRRGTRESSPDSYTRSMEAPGSTSRTRHSGRGCRSLSAPPFNRANEAPSLTEIEAFFQGAEQLERRRFIERYNFDPANERPLRGRYEWMSM